MQDYILVELPKVAFHTELLLYSCNYITVAQLTILPFAGQHFSGSLFWLITLLLCVRETTKGTRVSLSLAYARLVHSAKAPLDLSSPVKQSGTSECLRKQDSALYPEVFSLALPLSLLTPVPRKGVGDKTHKRLRLKSRCKRVADALFDPGGCTDIFG